MFKIRNIFQNKKPKERQEDPWSPEKDIPTEEISTPQIDLPMGLTLSVGTDIGTREYQQDSYAVSTAHGEFAAIICDGMGGLDGGELASEAAVDAWVALYESGFSDFPSFAEQAVKTMDRAVRERESAGGTTAAAIWIKENQLHWMSIGDSKIYIARDGTLASATREHNYQLVLDARLKRKEITAAEYEKESKKGASLVSYIGRGQTPLIDISQEPLKLRKGDTVLICSDGLYKSLPEEKLEKILASYAGDFETIAAYLLDYSARVSRTRDNTTVIAVRYEGDCLSVLDGEM